MHVSAAAAAKSLQSCLTLCDPIDGSPPGSPVPEILQARTLERVYMYLISPKLPSNPGCHIPLSSLCYTVGPCWLSILNMAVYTRWCSISLSLPPSFPLATVISRTNHPELLGTPSSVGGISFVWAHLAVPNSWNPLPCVLLWRSPTPLHSCDSSQGTPPPGPPPESQQRIVVEGPHLGLDLQICGSPGSLARGRGSGYPASPKIT